MLKTNGLILMLFFPVLAMSNVGFRCPDLDKEIALADRGNILTLIVNDLKSGSTEVNDRLMLPQGSDSENYQLRMGVYNLMIDQALLNFPYPPEVVLRYHAPRARTIYRKGFLGFEGKGEAITLNKMYCSAFIKSIFSF